MLKDEFIALIDCNSFFCSCERLFRPDLKFSPVIVLSNNDGCVIARTKEAKSLGIAMCAPFFQIKEFCKKNEIMAFSSNFSLYTDVSNRVMETLGRFAGVLDPYSIDEAFLTIPKGDQNSLYTVGREIRETILKEVGIPVSVGIGRTKVLAKTANHLAKRYENYNGVFSFGDKHCEEDLLKNIPLENIWGINKKMAIRMRLLGIKNVLEFRDFENEKLIQKVMTKVGLQLKHELMGIKCLSVSSKEKKKDSIMCSRTFAGSLWSKKALKEAVATYASTACARLREQDSLCTIVEVFFRTSPHKEVTQHYAYDYKKILTATSDTRKVIKKAFELVDKMFISGVEYRKAGVRLLGIVDRGESPLNFFEDGDSLQDEYLMRAMDIINNREGKDSLKFMACGVGKSAFSMNREMLSPRYTACWSSLPKAK